MIMALSDKQYRVLMACLLEVMFWNFIVTFVFQTLPVADPKNPFRGGPNNI